MNIEYMFIPIANFSCTYTASSIASGSFFRSISFGLVSINMNSDDDGDGDDDNYNRMNDDDDDDDDDDGNGNVFG